MITETKEHAANGGGPKVTVEDDRTGMDDATLTRAFQDHLIFSLAKRANESTALDRFFALSLTVRDRLMHRWTQTKQLYRTSDCKRVY